VSEATARSPIAVASPAGVTAGWHVSQRRSEAALSLADWTPLAKVLVRTSPGGAVAQALRVEGGRTRRTTSGTLIIRPGPDEWLLLGPPGDAPGLVAQWEGVAGDGLTTVVDITSGRALLRLTGARAPDVLAKLCAVDVHAGTDGSAFRSTVAGVVTEVVRDDGDGAERSYLLACDRSFGQYLFDALLDSGGEFGVQVNGFFPEEDRR
jgi:heterotetrameric sarcosine oxidase gamma subunit